MRLEENRLLLKSPSKELQRNKLKSEDINFSVVVEVLGAIFDTKLRAMRQDNLRPPSMKCDE
ncbi:hypothetical protein PsorP6_001402 [Peronosclerospora sorghi]|uniref:Uncharacterized protein n=1 Tax=Peronosclerospora sorghi TaxID=230839 RepID=A0ACC0WX48_9STRA|nr:hypothetical protein PsorP6_001402 [Peronosclerospora sorghi]